MRLAEPAQDPRARLTAVLRAGVLAAVVLAILPLPAAAADPTQSPPPSAAPARDASPEPTPTPEPTPSLEPLPTPILERINLYRSQTVVRQYRSTWCVPAATQSMWNLVSGTTNTTYARQKSLYVQIRGHNRYRYKTKGNDVQGWAWALRQHTFLPYQWHAYTSKTAAINAIADAIDRTHHPVGITVHHGTHAWVVLGYRSSHDPATNKRTILGFYVHGPLGPGSRDPWKYSYMSIGTFRKVYGAYHERTRKVIWEHKYVLVSD